MIKAKENYYMQVADSSAIEVIQRKDRAGEMDSSLKRLNNKYGYIAALSSGDQWTHLVAIAAHFSMAILAGFNMVPILFSVETSIHQAATLSDYAVSILPISIVFFISIGIGMLISKIQLKRDEIAPNRFDYNHTYIWASMITVVIYFTLVYHIVRIGMDQVEAGHHIRIKLILTLSLAEIAIGTFAHKGWTTAMYRYRKWRYGLLIKRNRKNMLLARQKCDRYYQYYLQTAPPEDFYLTSNMEQVLVQGLSQGQLRA